MHVIGESPDSKKPAGMDSTVEYTVERGWIDEKIVDKYGILLIADEVQSGVGEWPRLAERIGMTSEMRMCLLATRTSGGLARARRRLAGAARTGGCSTTCTS